MKIWFQRIKRQVQRLRQRQHQQNFLPPSPLQVLREKNAFSSSRPLLTQWWTLILVTKKVREHLEKAFKLFPTKEHLKELDNQAVHFIPPEIGIVGQFL